MSKDGELVGRVVQGALKALINRKVDAEGNIYNDNGKGTVIQFPGFLHFR